MSFSPVIGQVRARDSRGCPALVSAVVCSVWCVVAQPTAVVVQTLTERDAVAAAVAHNPTLRAATLDMSRSQQVVASEEGRYGYAFRLEGGGTHTELPIATQAGVVPTRADQVDMLAALSRAFPWGTEITLQAKGAVANRRINPVATMATVVGVGPTYGVELKLGVTHPLMRRAGRQVGELRLDLARLELTAAEHERDRVASQLLSDVQIAYWELWFRERALAMERAAHGLAVEHHDAALKRAAAGALPDIDALPFEGQVARLAEAVLEAQLARDQRATALAPLLGASAGARVIEAVGEFPDVGGLDVSREAAVEAALLASHEIRKLTAEVEVARARAGVAADALRPRLDLQAYVALNGLASDQAPMGNGTAGQFDAVSAHVGAIYESPLSSTQHDADEAAARLAVETAEAELVARQQLIVADAGALADRYRASRERVQLAERNVVVARKLMEAEQSRDALGSAIPLRVLEADDVLRAAELRVLRARVDGLQAYIALEHLTGSLLRHRFAAPPR